MLDDELVPDLVLPEQEIDIPADIYASLVNYLGTAETLSERIDSLNKLRQFISQLSPFNHEPVDFVEWVQVDAIHANDYNPNAVAPPEMELLRLSVAADGYTQPIVTMPDESTHEVIDGFHRHRVGKECHEVHARLHGYLPIVHIRSDREDRGDRIAATIRHNRARGKHRIDAMSDIVIELKHRNWTNERIGRELGMEPDEVLRLCQITGLAELFNDDEFSASWDIVDNDDGADFVFDEGEDQ
jgi:ParB-like chromosome segregation protein Spo0J